MLEEWTLVYTVERRCKGDFNPDWYTEDEIAERLINQVKFPDYAAPERTAKPVRLLKGHTIVREFAAKGEE